MSDESEHLDVTVDPYQLGISPTGLGLPVDSWLRAKLTDDTKAQLDRIEAMLRELLERGQ